LVVKHADAVELELAGVNGGGNCFARFAKEFSEAPFTPANFGSILLACLMGNARI